MHGYKWPINCTRTRTAVAELTQAMGPVDPVGFLWSAGEDMYSG